MSEQTLKFDDNVVNKKDFHASKEEIALNVIDSSKVLISNKFKLNDDDCKYFIGYLHDDNVIKSLCIVLPQMNGHIKYFDNGRKNMSFSIEDESVCLKYTKIWHEIKKVLNIKFYSQPIHDDKYVKTKVKTFIRQLIHFFLIIKFQKKEVITFVLQQFILILCSKGEKIILKCT